MQNLRKKQRQIIFLLITIFVIFTTTIITCIFVNISEDLKYLLGFLVSIFTLVFMLILKRKYDVITYSYRHISLFEHMEPAVYAKDDLMSLSWITSLEKDGYTLFKELGGFSVYYMIGEGARKGSQYKTLFIYVLIKDPEISFENQVLVKTINLLEDYLKHDSKYKQRIIYQMKQSDYFSQEKAKETNLVMFISQKSTNLVLINVYHFKEDGVAFFVHSSKYPPTAYYEFATNELLKKIQQEQK